MKRRNAVAWPSEYDKLPVIRRYAFAPHVNPGDDGKLRVELIGPVAAPGGNGPSNGMYALVLARGRPALRHVVGRGWLPFVQGPNWCLRNRKCFTCQVRAQYRRTRREVFPILSRIQNIGYELRENDRSPEWVAREESAESPRPLARRPGDHATLTPRRERVWLRLQESMT